MSNDNTQAPTGGTGDVLSTKAALQDDGTTVKTIAVHPAFGQEGLNPTLVDDGSPLPVADDEGDALLEDIRDLFAVVADAFEGPPKIGDPRIQRALAASMLGNPGSADVSIAAFDPATLPLSLWNRSYAAATPWNGVSSAGTSGSVSWGVNGTDAIPSAGATLNGQTTAGLNGSTQSLASSTVLSSIVSTTGGLGGHSQFSGWFVLQASSVAFNEDIFGDSSGEVNPYVSTSGNVHFIVGATDTISIPFSLNTWYWIPFTYDGATLSVGLNTLPGQGTGGTRTASIAYTITGSGTLELGTLSTHFPGIIAEVAWSASLLATSDFTNVKSYINARYALGI